MSSVYTELKVGGRWQARRVTPESHQIPSSGFQLGPSRLPRAQTLLIVQLSPTVAPLHSLLCDLEQVTDPRPRPQSELWVST